MITLLHGDEEFTRSEALRALRRQVLQEEGLGDLNLTTLFPPPAPHLLRDHADTLPFLGEKRLLIVEGWLEALAHDIARGQERAMRLAQEIADYLPHLPNTTHLVFVEQVELKSQHPVVQRLRELIPEGKAEIRLFTLPHNARERREHIARWLRDRARDLDVELEPEAISRLVEVAGHNLRLLHQELEKLRAYAGKGGVITVGDVEHLVPYTREANVFHLVTAIGEGNARRAIALMQQVLSAGQHPLQVLALLARQFRIYIGLKDLAAQGRSPEEMARTLRIPPWTVRRDLRIAQRMSWPFLKRVMERLLETDAAIKQGEVDALMGVQMLVVRLTLTSR